MEALPLAQPFGYHPPPDSKPPPGADIPGPAPSAAAAVTVKL
jgi:hypothetical protein